MKIKSINIDSSYFEEKIEKYLKEEKIKKEDVISITEGHRFTTLWYWSE